MVHRAFGTYRLPSREIGTTSRSVFVLRISATARRRGPILVYLAELLLQLYDDGGYALCGHLVGYALREVHCQSRTSHYTDPGLALSDAHFGKLGLKAKGK
jgi:hypothetical protein